MMNKLHNDYQEEGSKTLRAYNDRVADMLYYMAEEYAGGYLLASSGLLSTRDLHIFSRKIMVPAKFSITFKKIFHKITISCGIFLFIP